MFKLKHILNEIIKSNDSYNINSKIAIANKKVKDFIERNSEEVNRLLASSDYMKLYHMAIVNIRGVDQMYLIQALNTNIVELNPVEPSVKVPSDSDSFEIDETSTTWEIEHEVSKWVKRNRTKLLKLADSDQYKEFYGLVKNEFPKAQEWKLLMAMNRAAIEHHIHYSFYTDKD
jgi:hypothetical protein